MKNVRAALICVQIHVVCTASMLSSPVAVYLDFISMTYQLLPAPRPSLSLGRLGRPVPPIVPFWAKAGMSHRQLVVMHIWGH